MYLNSLNSFILTFCVLYVLQLLIKLTFTNRLVQTLTAMHICIGSSNHEPRVTLFFHLRWPCYFYSIFTAPFKSLFILNLQPKQLYIELPPRFLFTLPHLQHFFDVQLSFYTITLHLYSSALYLSLSKNFLWAKVVIFLTFLVDNTLLCFFDTSLVLKSPITIVL